MKLSAARPRTTTGCPLVRHDEVASHSPILVNLRRINMALVPLDPRKNYKPVPKKDRAKWIENEDGEPGPKFDPTAAKAPEKESDKGEEKKESE